MKRIIVLVGLAGSGKSTSARFLKRVCGARVLHLPATIGHLVSSEERELSRRYARLLPGVVSTFLGEVDNASEMVVVLDGFPRSIEQVQLRHQAANERGWSVELVYLQMPGRLGILHSALRQVRRDLAAGTELRRIYWKLRRDLPTLPGVLAEADRLQIPIRLIDALETEDRMQEQLRQRLGLDLQSLPWDREMLQTLASLVPDAWVTGGGHVYRPFFDNRFGPPTDSWDVDIRVWGEQRAEEVREKLHRYVPKRRWHVKDALSWSRKEIGREVSSVEDSFSANALICLCIGIRWVGHRIEVRWGHLDAEGDLRQGILRPNPHGQVGFAGAKAKKIIGYYPAVSAPFLGYTPARIALTYDEAMAQVRLTEKGGTHGSVELSPAEQMIADQTLKLWQSLPQNPLWVLWPSPAALPEGDPWLAEDRRFRVWLVNQVRSRSPTGGRDQYLENALRVQTGVAQKSTHQGWGLHLHALHALLELETDQLPDYRRPLRLAMLWHDVGKLWNVNTPGAHPLIGAKKWHELQGARFPGLSDDEEALISHFIKCHDLFGRLGRVLWDESYHGGMSPAAVRRALYSHCVLEPIMVKIAKAMWLADIGSIPLLRWLRPLADPLEALVTQKQPYDVLRPDTR